MVTDDGKWTLPSIVQSTGSREVSADNSRNSSSAPEHQKGGKAHVVEQGSAAFEIVGAVAVDASDPEGFRMKIDRRTAAEGGTGRSAVTRVQVLQRGYLAPEAFAHSNNQLSNTKAPVTKLLLQPLSGGDISPTHRADIDNDWEMHVADPQLLFHLQEGKEEKVWSPRRKRMLLAAAVTFRRVGRDHRRRPSCASKQKERRCETLRLKESRTICESG